MNGFKELTDKGYIHRDIKPENALMHEVNKFTYIIKFQGVHKVADFGFATRVDIRSRQLMKDCVGTPLYMSP